MRTKTLLLTAATVAAGALSSMAQNVYSVNVVGYVNVVVPAGYSTIANPLSASDNTVTALFNTASTTGSQPALGANLFTWNGSSFQANNNDAFGGGWQFPSNTVPPGLGVFFQNVNTVFTNTFVGTVVQGPATNAVPVGYSMQASQWPVQDFLFNLGFPTNNLGDNVFLWNGSAFIAVNNDIFGSGWSPTPTAAGHQVDPVLGPKIGVGESFFYQNVNGQGLGAYSWTTSFTVQ